MCGIAGIFESSPVKYPGALPAMLRAMTARGPDDEGQCSIEVRSGGAWKLGTRRLAILDLSPAGHQPMHDPATENWITYNGEVFNFLELRKELESAGCVFRSQCDTEVILQGYRHWDSALFTKLEGMFALGLWDAARQTMLLVRDRHGIKPLYYHAGHGCFLFASEVRALLATGQVPRELDPAGLDSFLTFGAVSEPTTILRDVRLLPAGHLLRWTPESMRSAPYVELFASRPATNGHQRARQEMVEELQTRLQRAVSLRLVSDVPLGVFLSGGLDSSTIAALTCAAGRDVRTFNVTFPEKRFAEGEKARRVAQHLGTDHQELELSQRDLLAGLPQGLAAMDQPTVDGINTYFVSRMTKEAGLTVALSGLGGDELFAGYRSFRQVPRLEGLQRRVPMWARHSAGALLARLATDGSQRRLAAWLRNEDGYGHPYFLSRMLLLPGRLAGMLRPEWMMRVDFTPLAGEQQRARTAALRYDPVNRVSCFELSSYLRNMLLRDTDMMSMAHSLEVRAPMLDHQLTDLLLRIPGSWKMNGRQNKPLLVEAAHSHLPGEILAQPKRGFELPWEKWLKGALRCEVEETLAESGPALGAVFQWSKVRVVWNDFVGGREHWSRPWLFYVLRKWTERHLTA